MRLECLRYENFARISVLKMSAPKTPPQANAFSHFAAAELLPQLSKLAESSGVSLGTIINSDHIGAVGIHAALSMISGKIIVGFTNADALANSPDGKTTIFGTNPISCVFRNSKTELLYIDLATTQFSMNKVKNFRRSKTELPTGVARDENYKITTDPNKAVTLEPIGEHKGFALAFMVEILTSSILGRSISKNIMPMYGTDLTQRRVLTHTFMVIDPSVMLGGSSSNVWNSISEIREFLLPAQLGNSPGIKEMRIMSERQESGIPVPEEIIKQWKGLGFDE